MSSTSFVHDRTSLRMRALTIIEILEKSTHAFTVPAGEAIIDRFGKDPYLILISCILSLRTKDSTSLPASCRLFDVAQNPYTLIQLSPEMIASLIRPVNFYRRKSHVIHAISTYLIEHYKGKVPATEAELLALPGVGRKTANLVLSIGFDIPALCVDIHVHRISNRLGLVTTKTPLETERQLQKILPKKYWSRYNALCVMWGQNICVPISPFCSRCPLQSHCERVSVTRSR